MSDLVVKMDAVSLSRNNDFDSKFDTPPCAELCCHWMWLWRLTFSQNALKSEKPVACNTTLCKWCDWLLLRNQRVWIHWKTLRRGAQVWAHIRLWSAINILVIASIMPSSSCQLLYIFALCRCLTFVWSIIPRVSLAAMQTLIVIILAKLFNQLKLNKCNLRKVNQQWW